MVGIALTSCLLFFTVYGAIIPDQDEPLKRIARCDVCGQAQIRIPHPPPPPFFHTHQWSGLARHGQGQEVFSGAAAAANGGAQASGEAFSLASSSVNSGSGQGGSYKGAQYYQNDENRNYGYGRSDYSAGASQGQQVQSSGFESAASSQAQSGSGKPWEQSKLRSNHVSQGSGSGSYEEANNYHSRAGQSASQNIGHHFGKGFADQGQKSQSNAFGSAATSHAESGAANSWDQSKQGSNHVGHGSSVVGRGDLNEGQKYRNDAHAQVHEQGPHDGFGNAGQQHQSAFGNSAHGNYEIQSSHNHAVDTGFAGNNQQVQKVNYEGGKWEKNFGSNGDHGASQSSSSFRVDSAGVHDDGQATVHGALNLASQGLQTAQQTYSASQPGCSTCSKSNYALSNAKSRSGNAVAVSIGG